MNITGQQVVSFWLFMQAKYGFEVVQKADAEEMQAIAWALELMGIQDNEEFMKKYTTTIGTKVYVPFLIGRGSQQQLISQILTCVHEAEHVVQYNRGKAKFMIKYLSDDTARTNYEVDAYRTNMEMYYYFTGKILSPGGLAKKLEGYSVDAVDQTVAKKHLIVSAKVVKHGCIVSNTSKAAIRYWERRRKQTGIERKVHLIRQ